jgi:RNA polymerase sigma-70 factor (sigma-E family)
VQPFRDLVRHHGVIVDEDNSAETAVTAVGDEAVFSAFYERQLGPTVRLAHLIVGSPSLAQDVVHDVFVSIHARWSLIDKPDAYLRTAVINRCRSAQRRQIVERLHLRRPVDVVSADIPDIDETWSAVRRLPVDQRTVLVLRFYADLSLAEIAAELGKPIGTVKSTLHRALARLKEQLS